MDPVRRNNKRRATNVKVTKRATPQNSNANATAAGNKSNSGGAQEDGSGQDKEFMGVVSLVQLERHYGFIEVCERCGGAMVSFYAASCVALELKFRQRQLTNFPLFFAWVRCL